MIQAKNRRVEVIVVESECLKKQRLRDFAQEYGSKSAWIYVIEPYKYTKRRKRTKKQVSRISEYLSALEEGFGRSGNVS